MRVFSGIRPTGHIHLGNYLGAIRTWKELPDDSFYCVVDQHALTTREDSCDLAHNTRVIAAVYIACGLGNRMLFAQSHVRGHTELAWYLSCVTPLGWLNRMTQFKEKSGKNKEDACLGLYAYPVLMAADILLYDTTHVPVGADQKQHVELARDLAGAFNRYVGTDTLIIPEPVIREETARIMSLRDGTKKMSKSDLSDYSRIHLLDSDDHIRQKIKKATTDSLPIPASFDETRPEVCNLLSIYSLITHQPIAHVYKTFEGQNFSHFKTDLTDALIAYLTPLRSRILELLKNPQEIDDHLKKGAMKANEVANKTLMRVRKALNIL